MRKNDTRWNEYMELRNNIKNDIVSLMKEHNLTCVNFKMDADGNLPDSKGYDSADVANSAIYMDTDDGYDKGILSTLKLVNDTLYADCVASDGEPYEMQWIEDDAMVLIQVLESLEIWVENGVF